MTCTDRETRQLVDELLSEPQPNACDRPASLGTAAGAPAATSYRMRGALGIHSNARVPSIFDLRLLTEDSEEADQKRKDLMMAVFQPPRVGLNGGQAPVEHPEQPPSCLACLAPPVLPAWFWRLRHQIHDTMEHPESSRLAAVYACFIFATVLLSTVTFVVETVPSVERNAHLYHQLQTIDLVCIIIFTIDYVVRLLCCSRLFYFLVSPFNIIDLLSVLPYYVRLIVVATTGGGADEALGARFLRVLRVVRLLRLLKASARFQGAALMVDAVVASFDVLCMLALLLLIVLVCFASVVYFIEGASSSTKLDSIPQSMYFIQTTITTVGYGDITPATNWGKFAVALIMLTGVLVLALPISVMGSSFNDAYAQHKAARRASRNASKTWLQFKEFALGVRRHHAAMSDLMILWQETQAELEVSMASAHALAHALSLMQGELARGGPCEGGEQRLKAVCMREAEVRYHIDAAKGKLMELKALRELAGRVDAGRLCDELDRVHAAYRALGKQFEDGQAELSKVTQLVLGILSHQQHSDNQPQSDMSGVAPCPCHPPDSTLLGTRDSKGCSSASAGSPGAASHRHVAREVRHRLRQARLQPHVAIACSPEEPVTKS